MSHGFAAISILALFALTGLPPASAQSQTNPVPLINLPLVPTAVAPGGPSFILTVNGTGFVASSTVYWNGSALATTYVSGSQVTAQVPASNIAAAGTATIKVLNPEATTNATSNLVFLPLNVPIGSVPLVPGAGGRGNAGGGGDPVAADFNGDGIIDIVTVSYDSMSGYIALGNGDGSFQTPQPFSIGAANSFPEWAVAGDFNGDGRLDLAIANWNSSVPTPVASTVSILLGNGDGTFQPPQQYLESPGQDNSGDRLVVGDFNNDGNLDVAVSHVGGGISVLLGNGDGTLQPPILVPTTHQVTALATADFNSDGRLDLAVVGDYSNASILLGNGDGTFQSPQPLSPAISPNSVVAEDLNGDGKVDIAIGNRCGSDPNCLIEGTISVFLGNGDGTFRPRTDYAAGYVLESFIAVDLNNDGRVDLVSASYCGALGGPYCAKNGIIGFDDVSVLLGNGDGTFQPELVPDYASQGSMGPPYPLIAADFNGDGRLDLAGGYSDGVTVLLQTTLGISSTALTFASQNVGSTSSPQPATLTNVASQGTLSISNTEVTGFNAGDFSITSTCPQGLPPTQQCQVNTVFNPTAAGVRTATVTITDSAVGSPHAITVSGTGVAAPAVTLSSTSLTFAGQTAGITSPPQALTLTNSGSATLTISSIATAGEFPEWNNCNASLAPGASCKITTVR